MTLNMLVKTKNKNSNKNKMFENQEIWAKNIDAIFFPWTNKANTNGTDRKFNIFNLKVLFYNKKTLLNFIKKKKKNLQSLINLMSYSQIPSRMWKKKKSYYSCEWVKKWFFYVPFFFVKENSLSQQAANLLCNLWEERKTI